MSSSFRNLYLRKAAAAASLAAAFVSLVVVAGGCRITEDDRRLWLYAGRVYYPGDKDIRVEVETYGVRDVEMSVYRLDLVKAAGRKDVNLHSLSGLDLGGARPLKTWSVRLSGEWGYWNYQETNVPVEGAGAYLVVGRGGGLTASTLLVVTPMALVTKADDDSLLVYAADRMSGEPLANVHIYTFPPIGEKMTTDADGLFYKKGIVLPEDAGDFVVVGEKDGAVALCDAYFSRYTYDTYRGYTYTDRPIYRPGQTVRMKGILRRYLGGEYENLPNEPVTVEVRDPQNNPVFKADLTTSAFGSFAAEFALGDEPALGRYVIAAKFGDQNFASYFDVEEYRKPEYEVTVTAGDDFYLPGEVLTFNVAGKYYFGAPVAQAEVRYEVQRRAVYSYGRRWYRYDWYFEDYDYDYYDYYGWEAVARGEDRLDDDGVYRGSVPIPSDLDGNYEYRIEAVMTDASRKEVTGAAAVAVWRAGLSLAASTDRYCYRPGDAVEIIFDAKDPLGQPYPTAVAFDVTTRRWADKEWVEEKVTSGKVATAADGRARWKFAASKNGYYEVRASAADDRGREALAQTYFYVADESYYHSYYSGSGVTVITDKKEYAPGETAQVFIQTPREGAGILFTVEGDALYRGEVARTQGNAALIALPIEKTYAPNVFLSATVISDDSYTTGGVHLVVPPADRFLNVAIARDKAQYRPGDKASYVVKATDYEGKPVAAEVSLGVADESVYAVKADETPDIRKFFYDRRGIYVSTNTSFYFYSYGAGYLEAGGGGGLGAAEDIVLEAPADRAKTKATGKKEAATAYVEPVIRAYFPDTAFWGPQLVTDDNGEAAATFDIPDSLTTWRATARAITADTRVGQTEDKVVATKNLLIRLETPRVLTQRDEVYITGVVHNYLPTGARVRVELAAGPEVKLKGAASRELVVAAGGEARVDWPCLVEGVGDVTLTAKALTTVESDAMALTVPILPHGLEYVAAGARVESGSFEDTVTLPVDAVPGASVLEVTLAPSLAGTMLSALEYLAGYPYGCVEQTMSRFLPDVYVARTLQKLNLKNEKLEAELPKMTKQGLERLYGFQHNDGGWGWWTDDKTHPFMTAYVCFGLLKAREADLGVRDDVIRRGLESLKRQLDDRKAREGATYFYMLGVLADAGDAAADGPLREAYRWRKKDDAYALALLAQALAKRGMKAEAAACLADLDKLAVREGGFVHFAGVGEWHYSWQDSPIQTTATALRAILAVRGTDDPNLKGVVRWLMLNRRGSYWRSTQETAAVVFALSDYLAATRELEGDYAARVFVNGAPAGEMTVTPANVAAANLHLYIRDKDGVLKPGANVIRVDVTGTGKVYFGTLLTYFKQADELAPVDEGFAVSRKYYRLAGAGKEAEGIPAATSPGDRFRVEVRFRNDNPMEYVMLEDYVPSGFEVDEDALQRDYYYDWYYDNFHSERRDEKMAFFFTSLAAGDHVVSYVIHAEQPGRHLALPARASLMYAPEFWGSSGEAAFDVTLE